MGLRWNAAVDKLKLYSSQLEAKYLKLAVFLSREENCTLSHCFYKSETNVCTNVFAKTMCCDMLILR